MELLNSSFVSLRMLLSGRSEIRNRTAGPPSPLSSPHVCPSVSTPSSSPRPPLLYTVESIDLKMTHITTSFLLEIDNGTRLNETLRQCDNVYVLSQS